MNISSNLPAIQQKPVNADKDWKMNVNDHDGDDVQKTTPVEQQISMEKSVQTNLGQNLNTFA